MKKLQRFCVVVALTLTLALNAFAGDMPTPGATTPPTRQQSSVTSDTSIPDATNTGDMPTPGVVALDPVTEDALTLFQSLLSLF